MQTSSEEEQNSALSAQAELSIDRNIAAQSCADSAQNCAADVSNADDTNHVARLEKIMTSDLSEKDDTDDAVRFDMAMTEDKKKAKKNGRAHSPKARPLFIFPRP